MGFRAAVVADGAAIEEFLVRHSDTSMFLRANLRAFGPCGGEDRNATRIWLREKAGRVTGVFGITTAGFVLVQIPGGVPAREVAPILGPFEINAILGDGGQVAELRAALGLGGAEAQLDEEEPLYSLDLDDLVLPAGQGFRLRAAGAADVPMLVGWRTAYLVETIHFTEAEAADLAGQDVAGMMARKSLMVLEDADGRPLAMTSFNAILPDMVQVGNVFTPAEARGKGHARRAVALHLASARADGVKRAILFASGPAASRAYEAIGFRLIGSFTLLFFANSQIVKAAA